MPQFRSTKDILTDLERNELYNENNYDSNTAWLPVTKEWDYKRELTIDDVDIWEVIHEASGGLGIYASYVPWAEFYMVCSGLKPGDGRDPYIETYYGPGAQQKVADKAQQLGLPIGWFKTWVPEEESWLYQTSAHGK